MSLNRDRRNPPANQVPVIGYNEQEAAAAYAAFLGTLAHEEADPTLMENPFWQVLKRIAHKNFCDEYTIQVESER